MRLGISVLIAAAITAALVIAAIEVYDARRKGHRRLSLDSRLSLSTIPPNVVMYVVLAPWWAFVYQQLTAFGGAPLAVNATTLAAAFIACDLSYYVEHRSAHQIGILWRLYHATHHSGAVFHIPLAYRVNFLNQLVAPLFYLPWVLLGFDPLLIIGFQLFVFHYQAWLHTEKIGRLGVLDRFFNTPANHRMHHSDLPEHRAVNLGAVTLLWDRLLGTYAAARDSVEYGITGRPAPNTYAGLYLDPWRRSGDGATGGVSPNHAPLSGLGAHPGQDDIE